MQLQLYMGSSTNGNIYYSNIVYCGWKQKWMSWEEFYKIILFY